jgi:hypothetical protein
VKRLTKNLLGIRVLTLGVLVVGVMTLSLFASSWATPNQSAQAQSIGEPPSAPERADDEGAQLVVNPGDSPDDEGVQAPVPIPDGDNGDIPETSTRPEPDADTDIEAPTSPTATPETRSVADRGESQDNTTDEAVQHTEAGTEVIIEPDGQVKVILDDGRTLLLGPVNELTIQDLMALPITPEERQAILNAQYQYAVKQASTSASLFSKKAQPKTTMTTMTPAEVDALPVTEPERQVIKATQFQYSFLKMRMFFTRFLLFQ